MLTDTLTVERLSRTANRIRKPDLIVWSKESGSQPAGEKIDKRP